MAVNQAFESVSVHECSWADLTATINIPAGATFSILDFEGFKWGRKLERTTSNGISGGRPRKKTRGSVSYEGSASATRSGWQQLVEALEVAAEAVGDTRGNEVVLSGVSFDLILQHQPLGDTNLYAVKMSGCTFDGDSSDMKQGNEAEIIELALNPIKIATKSASGKWVVLA